MQHLLFRLMAAFKSPRDLPRHFWNGTFPISPSISLMSRLIADAGRWVNSYQPCDEGRKVANCRDRGGLQAMKYSDSWINTRIISGATLQESSRLRAVWPGRGVSGLICEFAFLGYAAYCATKVPGMLPQLYTQ